MKSYMWSCRWNPHKRNIFWVSVQLQVKIVSKADDFQNQAQPLEDLARRLKSHVFSVADPSHIYLVLYIFFSCVYFCLHLMFIYVKSLNLALSFLTLLRVEDANRTAVSF